MPRTDPNVLVDIIILEFLAFTDVGRKLEAF